MIDEKPRGETPIDGARWDVVGLGANSVDFVNLLPGYPQPFGAFAKMQIRDRRVLCGGQTATAMCTCAPRENRPSSISAAAPDATQSSFRAGAAR